MKKTYEMPEITVILFSDDVIASSNPCPTMTEIGG